MQCCSVQFPAHKRHHYCNECSKNKNTNHSLSNIKGTEESTTHLRLQGKPGKQTIHVAKVAEYEILQPPMKIWTKICEVNQKQTKNPTNCSMFSS